MRSVLFVDDDVHLLNGLRRALRSHNREWHIRYAEGGAEALTSLYAQPADVVVSDFRMPGMDGAELLSLVRQRWPDSVRLLLSGHTDDRDLARVSNLAHQFIAKPCETSELVSVLDRAMRIHEQLDGERIRLEVSRIGQLPSMPSAIRAVLAAIDSGTADAKLLASLVESDLGLSSKLLQLANSSFFAPRARTSSIEVAVVRIGSKAIRAMALLENVNRLLPPSMLGGSGWLERINEQAQRAAVLARMLAHPSQAEDAFCATLLAECGQLVLASCRPAEFGEILLERQTVPRPLDGCERERIGVTHAQVGAYLLSLWAFPIEIVDAVANHHRRPEPAELAARDLCAVVQLAHSVIAAEHPDPCTLALEPAELAILLSVPVVGPVIDRWRVASNGA